MKVVKMNNGRYYINRLTMNTYKHGTIMPSKLRVNTSVEGEPIETKVERLTNNKEPIAPIGGKDTAPLLFTERAEGVRASTNIRTDRFEIALEATEKVAKSYKARREEYGKKPKKDGEPESNVGEGTKDSTAKAS